MKDDKNGEKNRDSAPKQKIIKKLTREDIKDLALMDNDFFLFAIDDNKELADVLIKPAMDHLGIKNYQIVSVKAEVYYGNLKKHSTRVDCIIKLENDDRIFIEIQNGHPDDLPLKRIRLEHGSFDSKYLSKGQSPTKLPNIISLVYTTQPLPNHDNGATVNDFAVVDLSDLSIAEDYGIRTLVVNGKYKNEGYEDFSNLMEDLEQKNAQYVKNPVIKEIHESVKNTEKGATMLTNFIEENFGKTLREVEEENQKMHEQLQKSEEENQLKDLKIKEINEKNQKYKKLLIENGILPD